MPLSKSQRSLQKWTEEDWTTSDGEPSEGKKRYLPREAWADLTPAEKAATNRAKRKGDGGRTGKQHVAQPRKIAKKTARHR